MAHKWWIIFCKETNKRVVEGEDWEAQDNGWKGLLVDTLKCEHAKARWRSKKEGVATST